MIRQKSNPSSINRGGHYESFNTFQLDPQEENILDDFYRQRKNRSSSVKQHNLLKKNISYFNQIPNQSQQNMKSATQFNTIRRENCPSTNKSATPTETLRNYFDGGQSENSLKFISAANSRVNIKAFLNEHKSQNKENQYTNLVTVNKFNLQDKPIRVQQFGKTQRINSNAFQQNCSEDLQKRIAVYRKEMEQIAGSSLRRTHHQKTESDEHFINDSFRKSPEFFKHDDHLREESIKNEQSVSQFVSINKKEYEEFLEFHKNRELQEKQKILLIKAEQKISLLEKEILQRENQRKREEKLIQSIQKMKKMMDGTTQNCSLKQLWRWIKHLPSFSKN